MKQKLFILISLLGWIAPLATPRLFPHAEEQNDIQHEHISLEFQRGAQNLSKNIGDTAICNLNKARCDLKKF